MLYDSLKALHVLTAFGFFIVHGATMAVAWRLRSERDPTRLGALLDLSARSLGAFAGVNALIMLATGIAMGFLAAWWSTVWIWASVVLLVVITGVMTPFAAFRLNAIRSALGKQVGKRPAAPPVSQAELDAIMSRWDPRPISWIGGLGLAVIVMLMVLKPF